MSVPRRMLFPAIALLAACSAAPEGSGAPSFAVPSFAAAPVGGYKAVLVAGDGSLPVFDNAVLGVARHLQGRAGAAPGDIRRFSAAPDAIARGGAEPATRDAVLDAVARMRPGPGQGCLVFATSHGFPRRGLLLAATGPEALGPRALDAALLRGCGDAPTVVVVSGCFSGGFAAPPMARPNRVVLTAARADRPSFGCGAGRDYTVYDRCLLDAWDTEATWPAAYAAIRQCVTMAERRERFPASGPQAWFGPAAADLALPGR